MREALARILWRTDAYFTTSRSVLEQIDSGEISGLRPTEAGALRTDGPLDALELNRYQ